MRYFIGMDVGGTHCRMKVGDGSGRILGEFDGPGCSLNTDSEAVCRDRYRGLVLPALKKLGLTPEACGGLCAAASGLDFPAQAAGCGRIFEEMGFAGKAVRLVNDCEIFLCLSDGPALVLVSGTGSICYGRNAAGETVRCGGRNHVISDEGSGFDMGLMLLRAAGNWLDGRGGSETLARRIMEAAGVRSLEEINALVNASLFEKARIAALTRTGAETALQGDSEAEEIHRRTAVRLCRLAADTAKKMGEDPGYSGPLWLWGGLLEKNALLREFLLEEIKKHLPLAEGKVPERSALDIALGEAQKILTPPPQT